MKLLVIGSTGRTGRHVLEQGIRRGHEITAFSRRPHELANLAGLAGVIHGDALDLPQVRAAVQRQDAVISAVGGSGIARTLITALREQDRCRRVVMTSSRSVVATAPRLPVALAWLFFRGPYSDLARAEGMLEMSGLDWSVVRATMLNDKPGRGRVHIDFEANATGGEMTLPRADYAMTLLDVVEDPSLIGKALGVCGAKAQERATISRTERGA
jgi:putative NADH-flavin reductase